MSTVYPIEPVVCLTTDTAVLLQAVGVCDIDWMVLDGLIHGQFKAQTVVDHAGGLFNKRRRQGMITFEQLLSSINQKTRG